MYKAVFSLLQRIKRRRSSKEVLYQAFSVVCWLLITLMILITANWQGHIAMIPYASAGKKTADLGTVGNLAFV